MASSTSSAVLVRPVGPTGGAQRSADEITLQRPKTTMKKTFRLPSVPTSTSVADLCLAHVAPRVRVAVAKGKSVFVLPAGPPASGKSTTLRELMLAVPSEVFEAAAALDGEWMVCVSGAERDHTRSGPDGDQREHANA